MGGGCVWFSKKFIWSAGFICLCHMSPLNCGPIGKVNFYLSCFQGDVCMSEMVAFEV